MKAMVGYVLLFLTVVSVMVVAHARQRQGDKTPIVAVGPNEGVERGPDRTARQRWVAARS
jgi:hypothetical protein